MDTKIKKSILILISSSLIVGYLVILIDKKSQDIIDKKIIIAVRQRQEAEQSSLLADYKKVEPYLSKIKSDLPFSSFLNKLALKNNVKASFTFSDQISNASNFSINIEGSLGKFIKFVSDLEKAPYFIKINDFDISGSDLISSAQMTLNGVLYTK